MKQPILFLLLLLAVFQFSFAQQFTSRYELVNLGRDINTHYHEAAPVLSPDGKKLYFFVHNHPQNNHGTDGSDDIWISTLSDDGKWSAPVHMTAPFNNHRSNQVFTALPDGSLLIRGGKSVNSKGFTLISSSGQQTEITVPGFDTMNKGRFYGASMSSDGNHLIIYMSELAASIRSSLYVSHRQANGSWTTPRRMKISQRSDDFGPFISPDDRFLYFASDRGGPGAQGGHDIFRSQRLDDTWENWSEPVNLGPVINTRAADSYFCIDANGNVFISRANSTIDGGNLDLFVLVPKDIHVTIAGLVYDNKTMRPLPTEVEVRPKESSPLAVMANREGKYTMRVPEVDAYTVSASVPGYLPQQITVELPTITSDTTLVVDIPLQPVPKQLVLTGTVFDAKTGNPVTAAVNFSTRPAGIASDKVSAVNGNFSREIEQAGWYILTASTEGYLNTTDSIRIDDLEQEQISMSLYLQPIEVGLTVRLNNIYFDFDRTTLKSESFTELDKVVDFLQQNPTIEIEIAGHTDDKGSDEYNLNLSQGRAQSVVDYLSQNGVDRFRLVAKGYGESKPVDTNATEEGRAVNRRVEFTVLKK